MKYRSLNSTDQVERPSLEMTATYPSKLLFSWFDTVIYTGSKKPLEPSDLYNLQPSDSAKTISQVWRRNWSKETERVEMLSSKKNNHKTLPSIVRPLIKSVWALFVVSNIYCLINLLLQVVRNQQTFYNLMWLHFLYNRFPRV